MPSRRVSPPAPRGDNCTSSWAANWSPGRRHPGATGAGSPEGRSGRAAAHRQGDGAGRAVLAPRGRALDRAGPRQRQRQGADDARLRGVGEGQGAGRRQAAADGRAAAAVALLQAARPRHHARRPAGPADRVRQPARGAAARHLRRPARLQQRRACCCSPTTARSPATWSCRPPAGCAATGCARTAACSRPTSTS